MSQSGEAAQSLESRVTALELIATTILVDWACRNPSNPHKELRRLHRVAGRVLEQFESEDPLVAGVDMGAVGEALLATMQRAARRLEDILDPPVARDDAWRGGHGDER